MRSYDEQTVVNEVERKMEHLLEEVVTDLMAQRIRPETWLEWRSQYIDRELLGLRDRLRNG